MTLLVLSAQFTETENVIWETRNVRLAVTKLWKYDAMNLSKPINTLSKHMLTCATNHLISLYVQVKL